MHPPRSHHLRHLHPAPHPALQSLHASPPTDVLDAHAVHPALAVERDLGDLSLVDAGVLSGGGVDEVWTVPEEYGEYHDDVCWA